jgi:queuine/archaeosine tRNA-ribosyltransferase
MEDITPALRGARALLLVLGHPSSQVLRLWEIMDVNAIMLNAYMLAKSKRVYERIKEVGLREYFGVPDDVQTWLDSGGYQALRRGVRLRTEQVIRWYNELEPDYCIALDSPVAPNDPKMEEKVKENVRNAKEMKGKVPCSLLPVFHPVPEELLEVYMSGYSELGNMAAVGGLIPRILTVRNASRKEGYIFLERVRKEFSGWLHALGLGSATTIPILKSLGYNSTDTQTWRHKAAYGKIVLPGRGERHITDREVKFGRKKISEEERREALRIARKLGMSWEDLKKDFVKRAIFNAYILSTLT